MKKFSLVTLSVMLFLSAFFAGSAISVTAKEPKILEFDTMVGVPDGMTGTKSPIRGINGGGIPWQLTSAKGELKVQWSTGNRSPRIGLGNNWFESKCILSRACELSE